MTPPRRTARRAAQTAASQLARLLHLIPYLADGEEHPIEEVARITGATPAELVADLDALVERYDVPAGWVDGVQVTIGATHVSAHTDHFQRPMRLTMPELCALELGLEMARRERPAREQAPVATALERLRAVIPKLHRDERHESARAAELASGGAREHLAAVRAALRDRKKVRIRYRGGAAAEATDRVVSPYGVAFTNGMWYVVADCDDAGGVRFFRLDRIEQVERLDETFERPASFSMEKALPGGRAFRSDDATTMLVRYSPRVARWIAEREGRELSADGSLTLEHPLADREWAVRHVLQYGPDAEVLEPASLRAELARRLGALLA